MLDAFLLALCFLLIIEGLMPLLIPDRWMLYLMQMALQPSDSLRRLGGVMVVIGVVSAYFLLKQV